MQKPFIIAITGGIGSGKSTVSKKLTERGFHVYNTDIEARHLQNTDKELISQMKGLLGEEVFENNQMNRTKVAAMVFHDKELLKSLSQLVHPAVKRDFKLWVKQNQSNDLLFMECAVLFEGGFDSLVDYIVVVTADSAIRLERVMKRDNLSSEQVLLRMNNQKSQEELIEKSNYNLDTNSGDKFIDAQIEDILNLIPKHP